MTLIKTSLKDWACDVSCETTDATTDDDNHDLKLKDKAFEPRIASCDGFAQKVTRTSEIGLLKFPLVKLHFEMKFLFIFVFLGLAVSGCTRLYNTPEISKDLEFAGVRDIVPPGGNARLVLSHGMCSGEHDKGWADKRLNQIAKLIGAPPSSATLTERFPGKVERYDSTLVGAEGRTFDMTFLIYGRPIDAARKVLESDSGRGGEKPARASVNSAVRDVLMNDCLVDAVFYLGPNGDGIRRDTREFWCGYLGGKVTMSTGRPDKSLKCRIDRVGITSNAPIFLIPESLGSKVVFDAYRQVDVTGRVARADALGPVGGIHLVTNQVLLLDQAGIASQDDQVTTQRRDGQAGGSISPSLDSFLSDAVGGVSPRTVDITSEPFKVPVVAYTDPNDVLGYRLLPDGDFDSITVVNVLLSNAGTFLPGAPIIANPIDAHRGAENQGMIFEMILGGSDRVSRWIE